MSDRLRGVEQVGQPDAPTPIPIDEAKPLVARAEGELEAIVRDLADRDPILSVGGNEEADYVCSLCPDDWCEQQPWFERAEDVKHSPQCAWSLAVEWVAAHPVSGTETTGG